MIELLSIATDGFSVEKVFAGALLLFMTVGLALIFIAFVADAIYNLFYNLTHYKQSKNHSSHGNTF